METLKISLQGTARFFFCGSHSTLLSAALESGLGFPYECGSGSCGTCRFNLVSGGVKTVWPEAPRLSDRDRHLGSRFLACQSMPTQDSVIAMRLDDAYVPPRRPQQRRATLVDRRAVTHDIMEFTFAADGSADFLAGQYMLLRYGSLLRPRAYSMSNTPNGAGFWQFVVKRVANGAATTWLFDSIRPGDSTELWGPIGRAYLRPEAARPILCVAGGSGLAPMLSIARAHSKSDDTERKEIQFFYGGREPRDLLPEELLSELSRLPSVKYWSALSLPDQGWTGLRGLIDQVVESVLGPFLKAYEVYFAGPPAMVEAMIRMLVRCRVPMDQVHYDSFY